MSKPKPTLQLHFDVNGTIILQDLSNGKVDMIPILQNSLSKLSVVTINENSQPVWNNCTDWKNWETNIDPNKNEMNLETYLLTQREYLESHDKRRQFYASFYKKFLKKDFDKLVEEMVQKCDNLFAKKKQDYHNIIPSFFTLLNHLKREKRKFSVFIRTFGPSDRVDALRKELNDYFQGNHLYSESKYDDISLNKEHVGVFHRDRNGITLNFNEQQRPPNAIQWAKTFFKTVARHNKDKSKTRRFSYHVLDGHDERSSEHFSKLSNHHVFNGYNAIFQKLFELSDVTQQPLILRDDYPWWKANKQEYHCGKVLLVNTKNLDKLHPIIFDDNILIHNNDPNIVDVIDVNEIEVEESHAKENRISYKDSINLFMVSANILKAFADDQYFIDLVSKCEKKREERY